MSLTGAINISAINIKSSGVLYTAAINIKYRVVGHPVLFALAARSANRSHCSRQRDGVLEARTLSL